MPSSSNVSNVNRPVRQAALAGQAKRKQSDKYYRKLDAKFKKDMGTSRDKITKTGSRRKEFHGR